MIFNQKFSPELQMFYAENRGEITIVKYEGNEANVVIPASIDGFPVTKIEPYAFSEKQMRYITFPETLITIDHHGFSECRQLTHVVLPPKLKSIGNYCFYNCWNIESVHFTPYIRSIGFGAFMNCEKLTDIIQDKLPDHPISLGSLLDELIHQIHLEMRYIQPDGSYLSGKLTFTEYVIEVVADAAAIASICKQFISEYTGSGRSLRYCISSDGIDFKTYDKMFIKIFYKDSFDIAITVAMERLMFPYDLTPKAKEDFLGYVKEHSSDALTKFIKEDDLEKLTFLLGLELSESNEIDDAIDLTTALGKTEFTALLMDYKHQHFSMMDEDFDFDL